MMTICYSDCEVSYKGLILPKSQPSRHVIRNAFFMRNNGFRDELAAVCDLRLTGDAMRVPTLHKK